MNKAQRLPVALLQQALDVYRQPLRYRALWADPHYALPEGVGDLLDLALAAPEALDGPAARLHAGREELAAAIHFFIRQALLAEEGDAYRVLGLTPAATPGQVKAHYRKLMSLYHPDRDVGNEWSAVYAPRINRAYDILRHPDRHPAAARAGPGFSGDAGKAAVRALPRQHALPKTYPQFSGQRPGGGFLARCKPPRLRGRGFVMSCVAAAAGVGFIFWNLASWPVLPDPPRPRPAAPAFANPPSVPPLPLLESGPPAPVKPTSPEAAPPAGLDARVAPKNAAQPANQGRRR